MHDKPSPYSLASVLKHLTGIACFLCAARAYTSFAVEGNDHRPGQFEHHPDVDVVLFAAEPDVVDPVSIAFAANGDCYVVEMRDYPYGFGPDRKPGGTIRLLRDTNQDGRADHSVVFARELSYPTSVMPWRQGILVLAPPQILYLEDTDGDDRADLRRLLVEGLKLGVTDSNANSLRWGLDNLVHVANGGNGGDIRATARPQDVVRLSNCDFSFDPDTGQIVKTSNTGGGFGLVFDAFGRSFTTYNIDYLQQRVMPVKYVERNPAVEPFTTTVNISDHGASARIFPIVRAQTRVNHPEQAGHFSSAGGMGILDRGAFSKRLSSSDFVCDVVCNLVHRDQLREVGPAFRAARAPEEQDREFLASRDPAFRPVGLEHGPDGALYLVDMQRDVIEHPDYIPARVLQNLDVRAGENRGRIYRIKPQQGLPAVAPNLQQATARELVRALASPHRWPQETAHRLLIERRPPGAEKLLREHALRAGSAPARVRALWILDAFAELTEDDLVTASQDVHPGVRENAVILTEAARWLGRRSRDAAPRPCRRSRAGSIPGSVGARRCTPREKGGRAAGANPSRLPARMVPPGRDAGDRRGCRGLAAVSLGVSELRPAAQWRCTSGADRRVELNRSAAERER